jgi:hypothetical protein
MGRAAGIGCWDCLLIHGAGLLEIYFCRVKAIRLWSAVTVWKF